MASDAQPRVGIQQVDRPLAGRDAGQYIVVLRDSEDALAVAAATASLSGGQLRHVYHTAINGFAVDLPASVARALAADPRVQYVEEDGVLTLAAAASAQGPPRWGLDRINQRTLPLDANDQATRDGTGVHVHVVDTGIRVTHAEFGGRAFIAGDYVEDDGDGADCHGHGTHVAGTIGGATYGVAKNVSLWAHRVLDCRGAGSTSALIAAVDAITRDSIRRPAVVNISLVAPASRALDTAIRRSIASGLTYVVAAGNGDVDSAGLSPARVADAITVGATTARDRRASFSNFGTVIDLFAPGHAIVSASMANDTAVTTMSGTSAAAAHVAGVAALHLGDHQDTRPADVQSALLFAATTGVLKRLGPRTPDRLLYSEPLEEYSEAAADSGELLALAAGPSVSLVSPGKGTDGGIGSTQRIAWTHNLGVETQMRIEVSRDGGVTWAVVASAVTNKARSGLFNWTVTGPATTSALIRVSWTGGKAVGVSARFRIAAPFVRVTAPNGGEAWVSGSTATVEWTDNFGAADRVEIRLSTNGGGSYPILLGRTKAAGTYRVAVQSSWVTASAKVRVTWLTNPVTDTSSKNFQIGDSPPAPAGKHVMFGASPDHETLVNSYLLEIFAAGDDTSTATPIASRDLGKPAVVKGECRADVAATVGALPLGTYQVTVAAVGAGGKARSAPFSFTR